MMSCRKNRAIVCSIVPVLALMGAALIVAVSQASGSGAAASAAQKKACTPSLTKRSRSPAYAHTPWPTEHADAWRTHAVPTGLPAAVRHVRLVTASAKLPAEPVWGYVGRAASNGDLILKGWASAGSGENAPGTLLRVNPDDLSFSPNSVSGISSARMALVGAGGSEYIYLPGPTQSVRFVISGSMFTLDPGWSSTYLGTGDTQASSDVYMGHGVVFASNTSPQATTATRVFAKGVDPAAPLHSYQAFRHKNQVGWNFFMMAGDPYRSGIAAVGDQATGRVAGYQVCGGGTAARKLWENDDIRSSAGMAINYKAGHLYTDDRRCPRRRRCRLFLVVLDLHTGDELARVRVRGTKPSMGQIFIGRRSVYYVATQTGTRHGFITRVTAPHR
jgi:hypothetical protein